MKRITKFVAVIFFSIFAAACSESTSNHGFTIEFQLDEMPDCNFFVSERIPNQLSWFKDTLELKNGKAKYCGYVNYPRMTNFYFAKGQNIYGTIEVFLDNSSSIKIKGKNVHDAEVIGCKTHNDYLVINESLSNEFKEIENVSEKISDAYRENKDSYVLESLKQTKDQAKMSLLMKMLKIPGYATSSICPYIIYTYFLGNTELLEMALSALDASLDDNGYVMEEKEEINRQKKTGVGQQAFNFIMKDINGKEYSLSDYEGKYLLVEFSSSWCGWCKQEVPFLQKVYKEHKNNQEFAMITISMDDIEEIWVEHVKKEKLSWPMISDLKGFKGETAQAFNVKAIPMIYLIDKKGKILMKGLRGEDMVNKLREILK